MTKKEQHIYLAGLFDGEGCVRLSRGGKNRRYHQLYCRICNTNPEPLKLCQKLFGGSVLPHGKKMRQNHRISWHWYISSRKAESFLKAIQPYVIIKKDEGQVRLICNYLHFIG